jgi:class 3 adenylate cyclase
MQRALADQDWPKGEQLRVRMGVHTGEASEASTGLVGYEVHRAARIGVAAHGDGRSRRSRDGRRERR